MSEVYIRSQNREKLYRFGISFNALEYSEKQDFKRGKEAEVHHTICISDGCLEEMPRLGDIPGKVYSRL